MRTKAKCELFNNENVEVGHSASLRNPVDDQLCNDSVIHPVLGTYASEN